MTNLHGKKWTAYYLKLIIYFLYLKLVNHLLNHRPKMCLIEYNIGTSNFHNMLSVLLNFIECFFGYQFKVTRKFINLTPLQLMLLEIITFIHEIFYQNHNLTICDFTITSKNMKKQSVWVMLSLHFLALSAWIVKLSRKMPDYFCQLSSPPEGWEESLLQWKISLL